MALSAIPDRIQADLPLKHVWALVPTEPEAEMRRDSSHADLR